MSQELSNSSRRLEKATYAPIQLDPTTASTLARPFEKAATLNSMRLQTGEVNAVQSAMGSAASSIPASSWSAIIRFEPQPVGVLMPGASATANLPSTDLQTFAKALVNYRVANMNNALSAPSPPPQPSPQPSSGPPAGPNTPPPPPAGPNTPPPRPGVAGAAAPGSAPKVTPRVSPAIASLVVPRQAPAMVPPAAPQIQPGKMQMAMGIGNITPAQMAGQYSLVTAAQNASQNFDQAVQIAPIGRLHLERLEMTPTGIERGELLATIPLAPQETTGVMQKEWSTTSDEFSSIVTDSLEQVSEKGVTEKSELAQSSDSQTKHDNQIDLSASVSGKYGFVSFAANSKMSLKDSLSDSEKVSRTHSIETTRKASTRSRKERKVTIQQVSTTGSEQVTTRTLTNPSATNALRIDYYSMMRKWRVRLYRYGLRMTYDLAIPEPGVALREQIAELQYLNTQIANVFSFPLAPADIDPNKWMAFEEQYGVVVDPPPTADGPMHISQIPLPKSGDQEGAQTGSITINVKPGNVINSISIGGSASPWAAGGPYNADVSFGTSDGNVMITIKLQHFEDVGTLYDMTGRTPGMTPDDKSFAPDPNNPPTPPNPQLPTQVSFPSLNGLGGQIVIPFIAYYVGSGFLYADVTFSLSADAVTTWQQKAWAAFRQAASDSFYLHQQALTARRDALQAQIAGVDTLTLRREEMEEVMKGVLKWMMGPSWDFMPPEVQAIFSTALTDDQRAKYGPDTGGGLWLALNQLTISGPQMQPSDWSNMFQYGEMVKFVQQAIEWENLLYFLYPYFWDVPTAWDFVRNLEHPDLTRQQFVRAGSARVVLTVRPGFEDAFASFMELGQLGQKLDTVIPSHPYLTIAQEIQAYNETNYPGIPPANPDAVPVNSQDAASTACSSKAAASTSPVSLTVDQTDGFQVGMTVTIDTYESDIQEAQTITSIPDATTIVVSQLKNAHDGSTTPFPIVQPGEAGVVIAEWYEYTPSHGTDIGLATPLPEMD